MFISFLNLTSTDYFASNTVSTAGRDFELWPFDFKI